MERREKSRAVQVQHQIILTCQTAPVKDFGVGRRKRKGELSNSLFERQLIGEKTGSNIIY